jgi:hypothetical protein
MSPIHCTFRPWPKASRHRFVVATLVLSLGFQAHSPAVAEDPARSEPASIQERRSVEGLAGSAGLRAQPDATICVGRAEALARFDRLDRDGDGRLTTTDMRRRDMRRDRHRLARTDPLAAPLDIDGDGNATRREVETLCPNADFSMRAVSLGNLALPSR